MNVESKQPLEVINSIAVQDRQLRHSRTRVFLTAVGAAGVVGAAQLVGLPKETIIEGIAATSATAMTAKEGVWFLRNRSSFLSRSDLKEARSALETEGLDRPEPVYGSRGGFPENVAKYMLAQQVRTTKTYLAERGRLQEYEQGKWIQTIPVKDIKPTQEDLDEVDSWEQEQREKGARFVKAISRSDRVIIECGNEINVNTTKVYLFPNKEDLWEHESMPLIRVMQAFGATHQELKDTVLNEDRFKSYVSGVYTKEGQQKIADFFGKKAFFYIGGEVIHYEESRYGVRHPKSMVYDGIVQYVHGYVREPYHCIEEVEPTKNRAEKLDLVIAKA